MAFFVAIREYGATPLTTKNFQERLQLHIKVTFLIGITLTVVLQFNPAFPFPFSLFYSWGIVALSFGGCQWLLSEVSFFFFLRKWEPGKWTVGRQWPLTFFHFLVGYGVLVLANEAVVPWLYPQFTGVSEEVRTWGLFLEFSPSGFLSPSSLLKWKSKNAGRQFGTGTAGKPAPRETKQGIFKGPAWERWILILSTSLSSLVDLPIIIQDSGKEWSGKPGLGNNQSHQRGRALFPHIREERSGIGGN